LIAQQSREKARTIPNLATTPEGHAFTRAESLANQVRAAFGFIGAPIWFKTHPRNKKNPAE
jgi:predicted GTPase